MGHIIDDQIISDLELTDKSLTDALRQAGIPSEQIILAWQDDSPSRARSNLSAQGSDWFDSTNPPISGAVS